MKSILDEMVEALKESKEALLNMSRRARETGHYGDFKDDDCPCTICKIDKALARVDQQKGGVA